MEVMVVFEILLEDDYRRNLSQDHYVNLQFDLNRKQTRSWSNPILYVTLTMKLRCSILVQTQCKQLVQIISSELRFIPKANKHKTMRQDKSTTRPQPVIRQEYNKAKTCIK